MTVKNPSAVSEPAPAAPPQPSRLAAMGSFLRGYRVKLGFAVLVGIAMHLCTILCSFLSAYMVGAAVTGAGIAELRPLLYALLALSLPLVLLPAIETSVSHIAAFRALTDIRAALYNAFERLAPAGLLERRSGDLGSTAMGDVELLELGFAHILPPSIVVFVVPGSAIAALAAIHWLLAVVLVPFVAAAIVVPFWVGGVVRRKGRGVRERAGAIGAEMADAVQGLREVLAFGAQQQILQSMKNRESELQEVEIAHGLSRGLEFGLSELAAATGMLAVTAVASRLTDAGVIPGALFPASIILSGSIFIPITVLMHFGRDLPLVLSAADRICRLLTARPAVSDGTVLPPPQPVSAEVRFEDVVFRYGPALPDVLRGVSFSIEPGEAVALVGHSGAGKSTCVSLLMRFWDVSAGRITVGGHDVRAFPQESLRELIGFVPQDVYLFNRTLRENICLGRPTAGDAEILEAAAAAQATGLIAGLPRGWETNLGERGATLSGGQRQRIAIARALLKKPPILIFDEAVSNLDVESEQALQQAVLEFRKGRTTLVIAHRLSTIRNADRIVVLEHGRVMESGTFDKLVAANGCFARLTAAGTRAPAFDADSHST